MKVGTRGQKIASLGAAATHAATKRLRELHAEEFAAILAKERRDRGLPEIKTRDAVQRLRERVAELEQELRDKVGPA